MKTDLQQQIEYALRATHRIDREMGHGGMSRLFAGVELATERQIVLKVLAPELSTGVDLERFQREILVARNLDHPSIVPVLSVGQIGKITFYTMPLISGESLRSLLERERQLSLERAIRIARHVASAIDYANKHNIVHRDIKPDNILVDSGDLSLVTDFGIARAIERSADIPSVTSTGFTLGTPLYMSPEQGAAERFIDGRSDVYSLGCVFYEMLAGEPPFTGVTAQAIIVRHMSEAPRSLRVVRPDVPQAVQDGVERALAKVPAARPPTATDFVESLEVTRAGGKTESPAVAAINRLARGPLALVAGFSIVMMLFVAVRAYNTSRAPPSVTSDLRRLAVLDFEDVSADRSLGYLASGLATSLVHELSNLGPLTVLSRDGLRTFRERAMPVDSIVTALRLGGLVVGSVQQSGTRLRVHVQLLDAHTRTPLESATFERPMGELFLLEDDLSRRVAALLRRRIGVSLRVREAVAGTRSTRARELAFRADRLRDDAGANVVSSDTGTMGATAAQLGSADSLLALATDADRAWILPVIDRGWVALELSRRQAGDQRARSLERAVDFADRAVRRDSQNAAALELRGASLYRQADVLTSTQDQFVDRLTRAQRDLQRAVLLDSSRATARGILALVYLARGNVTAGAREAQAALSADTYLRNGPSILLALYINNLMLGATADAWRWCSRGSEDYPRDARFMECQLTLLAEDDSRKPDPALAWQLVHDAGRLDPPERARAIGRPWLPIYREMMAAVVSARAGQRDSALATARRARAAVGGDSTLQTDLLYEDAYLHLVLGDRRVAAAMLAKYLAERPSLTALVFRHPRWKSITSDSMLVHEVAAAKRTVQ